MDSPKTQLWMTASLSDGLSAPWRILKDSLWFLWESWKQIWRVAGSVVGGCAGPFWRQDRKILLPHGSRPNSKDRGWKIGSQNCYYRNMSWASGALSAMIVCPDIKQKQPQDRKTIFETLVLPVAKILSPVARQAPLRLVPETSQTFQKFPDFPGSFPDFPWFLWDSTPQKWSNATMSICRVPQKQVGKRSSIVFFNFGHFLVTFLTLLSLLSSLFCRTPFAGLLLRQGEICNCSQYVLFRVPWTLTRNSRTGAIIGD